MIILHQNKNKIYLAYFFTLVFFVGLLLAWQKLSPSSQAASQPTEQSLASIVEVDMLSDVKAGLELAKLQWDDMQDQIAKAEQQEKLLASAQAFLNSKSSTTPTSTTQSSSTATTSIK